MKEFQLMRYLSKGKFIIFFVALIGAIAVYFYANSMQVYTATTVLRYANGAISEGMTPNGQKLDVSEIYSATVIKGAIEDLGLNTSVDEVRSNIKVKEIIPDDEELRKETALSKGDEYSYFPTDYIITYEVGSDKSARYASNMLNAVIESYYRYYSEKYVDQLILPNNASNISSNDYDYIESAEIIEQTAKDIDNYLMQKRASYPDFRASATGYSFADLENIYNHIINTNVPNLYAGILQNKNTKNNDLLLKKQNNYIAALEIDILNNTQKAESLKALIDNYTEKQIPDDGATTQNAAKDESGQPIIMDVDGYDRGLNVTTTYDDLIQEYVRINQAIQNAEIDKQHAQYIVSVFENNTRNQVLSDETEAEIESLVDMLNREYQVVQATARELNEYLGASYLNILNSVVTTQKVNTKLYLALALVFFLFFGCAGAVVIGRLSDFMEYILYTDKTTKLPNYQKIDEQINALSKKELDEQFTVMVIRLDNLAVLNETLGRSAGDTLLGDVGEILKSLSKNYGFIGSNKGGWFMGLFDHCSAAKAEIYLDLLSRSVADYNTRHVELQIQYSAAFTNSTEENSYNIRTLVHSTYAKIH